jgi:hypothetical protein
MNARHAYELIRVKFPSFSANVHDWRVLAHGDVGDAGRIEAFLREEFSCEELVVCISRKVGGLMPIQEAASAITAVLGSAEVRIANRDFTEFAVVGHPGVGTAWKQGHG